MYAVAASGQPAIDIRAGDAERERAAARLGTALAQGYLTLDQYQQRVGQVFAADTAGELRRVFADLPLDKIIRADPRRRARRAAAARTAVAVHVAAYLLMVVVCLVVWFAVALTASAWYFWPVWPMLGGAIGVVSHAVSVRAFVSPRAGAIAGAHRV